MSGKRGRGLYSGIRCGSVMSMAQGQRAYVYMCMCG